MPKKNLFDHHFKLSSILADLGILLLGYLSILVTALLRGGHGRPSIIGISTCSAQAWMIFLACNAACAICSLFSYKKHAPRLIHGEDPETARTFQ